MVTSRPPTYCQRHKRSLISRPSPCNRHARTARSQAHLGQGGMPVIVLTMHLNGVHSVHSSHAVTPYWPMQAVATYLQSDQLDCSDNMVALVCVSVKCLQRSACLRRAQTMSRSPSLSSSWRCRSSTTCRPTVGMAYKCRQCDSGLSHQRSTQPAVSACMTEACRVLAHYK